MITISRKVFLDTSVIFAAVLSETGGARQLFRLGEARVIQLIVGRNVLRECEAIVRRKAPASLPMLATLLEMGLVEVSNQPVNEFLKQASFLVAYPPDALILAEALSSGAGWFVTHDKTHFLKYNAVKDLALHICTPGDFLQALAEHFRDV